MSLKLLYSGRDSELLSGGKHGPSLQSQDQVREAAEYHTWVREVSHMFLLDPMHGIRRQMPKPCR